MTHAPTAGERCATRYRVVAWDTTPPKKIGGLTIRFRRPVTTATADGTAPAADVKVIWRDPRDAQHASRRWQRRRRPRSPAALPAPAWLGLDPPDRPRVHRARDRAGDAVGGQPHPPPPGGRSRGPRPARCTRCRSRCSTSCRSPTPASADGRRRAYDRIDTDVRAYVTQAEALPGARRSRRTNCGPDSWRTSRRVRRPTACAATCWRTCEHARYGPGDRLPDASPIGDHDRSAATGRLGHYRPWTLTARSRRR